MPVLEYLAENIPGLPFNASTSSPESSPIAGMPNCFEMNSAFIRAFS